MYNLSYESQGANTFLVYEIGEQDTLDTLSLGMLTNNKIPGLAQTIFTQMDSQRFVKFNVSAKVSVSQFFSGAVNRKRLLGVFKGIVNAMMAVEDYMLDPDSIIMDMDYIFTDVSTCETDLICLPITASASEKVDIGQFFKNIMATTQFEQTENMDHVAEIFNFLNSSPVFSIVEFGKLIERLEGQNQAAPIKVTPVQQSAVAQPTAPAAPKVPVAPAAPVAPKAPATPKAPVAPKAPAAPAGGMPVPPAPAAPAAEQKVEGDNMSFMYLMQHYNKDNAAAYKAQKEAKKNSGKAPAAPAAPAATPAYAIPVKGPSAPVPPAAPTAPAASGENGFGFAIPGQSAPAAPAAPVTPAAPITPAAPAAPVPSQGTPISSVQPAFMQNGIQGQSADFGDTTVLGAANKAMGETTVLGSAQGVAQMIAPHLIRFKNNEKISLNKPIYKIGSESGYADYCISDNRAVSHSHAQFIIRGGEYFLIDTNSTNHTFVNGAMIQSNSEVKVEHGDKIRFADEDFEFRLY